MKIKKLEVNGFRCLMNFKLDFDDGLTVIVGENDAGKSSLIDCLKCITQNKPVEFDDFNHDSDSITINIEIDNYKFIKTYKLIDRIISSEPLIAKPTTEYLDLINSTLRQENYDTTNAPNIEYIKRIAREFGFTVRSNSNIDTLKSNILDKLEEAAAGAEITINGATFPSFNNIQLDGRHFENVSAFFKEVFLKEKQASIWNEKIKEDMTIEEFVKEKIETYSEEITQKISDKGILERMKLFLKNLTEVKIEPIYQTRSLRIHSKAKSCIVVGHNT